jgi:hypothetical protein
MKKINFFVEGLNDQKFLESIIELSQIDNSQIEITPIGGWEKLHLSENAFEYNTDLGCKNIIFFDADSDSTKRRTEIIAKLKNPKLIDEIFLFPDNQNSGNLETLLLRIINPKYETINDCYDSYKSCIGGLSIANNYLDDKVKIYTYLALTNKKPKETDRDYLDRDAWNLDHKLILNLTDYFKKIIPKSQ